MCVLNVWLQRCNLRHDLVHAKPRHSVLSTCSMCTCLPASFSALHLQHQCDARGRGALHTHAAHPGGQVPQVCVGKYPASSVQLSMSLRTESLEYCLQSGH